MAEVLVLKVRFVGAPEEIWFPVTTETARDFRAKYAEWQQAGDDRRCFDFSVPEVTWSLRFSEIAAYRLESPPERKARH